MAQHNALTSWGLMILRGRCSLVKLAPVVTFYVFLLVVGAIGALAYLAMFMSHVPGAAEERLGKFEDLPRRLNEWVEDADLSEDGLVCERRHLMPNPSGHRLILQVRYRDPVTRDIVRVEPEVTIKRRRVRA